MANKLRSLIGASALGLAAMLPAKGAIFNVSEPIIGTNNVSLDVNAVNNDTGAIYNSAELNVFKELAEQLYALPANQTQYGSIAELMGDWNFGISNNAPGNVFDGWNSQIETDGSVSISNNDFDYDQWNSTSGSNTQAYTLLIPTSQLDFTGLSNYDPEKAGIVLSSQPKPDMFVASEGPGGALFSADSHNYQVQVPEPSTYAAIAGLLALAGAGLYRRRQQNESPSQKPGDLENKLN